MPNLRGNINPPVHWAEVVDGKVVRGGTTHESGFGSIVPRQGGEIMRVTKRDLRPPKPMSAADAIKRHQATQGYAEKRRQAYPPLGDLADALFHDWQNDPTKLVDYFKRVRAVKKKFPTE